MPYKDRKKQLQYFRDYGQKNRTAIRAKKLPKTHGITQSDYLDILAKQHGVCAICKKAETTVTRGHLQPLAVDHDHLTNQIRGLLCIKCNTALGLLDDSCERAQALISYLETSK